MRALLVCVLLALCIPALSQQPTPTPPISSENKQDHPATPNKEATDNQTKTANPSIVVNVLASPQGESSASDKTAKSNDQSSGDRAIIPTWVIAIATVVLTIATCVLACYTWKLWGATNKLVEEGRESAKKQLRAYIPSRRTLSR